MFRIINYVEVCSNSLLSLFDQTDKMYDANDKLFLDLNRKNQKLLECYIKPS